MDLKRNRKLNQIRKKILDYYQQVEVMDDEIKDALNFLKRLNFFTISTTNLVFPNDFSLKYKKFSFKIYYADDLKMHYVYHQNKKLFFPKSMTPKHIRKYYLSICVEQDAHSPHCYLDNNFHVNDGDVCLDIGAAEGNFSLGIVDKASKIYLFEAEKRWLEPLEATFDPWRNKVEIINKYVSNKDTNEYVRLDTFLKSERAADFIKIDTEGAEEEVLQGALDLFTGKKIKIAVTTYHNCDDEKRLTEFLKRHNLNIQNTNGYMIFLSDPNLSRKYLRRGLIRAQN